MHIQQTRYIILCLFYLLFIGSLFGSDYFWIGGSGDWSDISHWSTTSGGTQTHSQTPTANDDVHFDEASFSSPGQIVTINDAIAFTHNIDWSGAMHNPTFQVQNSNTILNIYGSVQFTNAMQVEYRGIINFFGDERDRNVNFEQFALGTSVHFLGAGSWRIGNRLEVSDLIEVQNGTLFLSTSQIYTAYFESSGTNVRTIHFENSTTTISGRSQPNSFKFPFQTGGENLSTTADNSTLIFTHINSKMMLFGAHDLELGSIIFDGESGQSEIENFSNAANLSLVGNLRSYHNLFINTNLKLDTLYLEAGYDYTIKSNAEIALNQIYLNGSCANSTLLRASESNIPAKITAGQPIVVEYLTLRDIHAIGSANATISIDLGNNIGWTISSKTAQSFYWIGGTGNWSDGSHWSSMSGGPAINCTPSLEDDVYFDASSFTAPNQSITVDQYNIFAHNMTWENIEPGSGLVGNSEQSIFINGSLEFDPNLNNQFEGLFIFVASDSDNSLISNGIPFKNSIEFNNSTGLWDIFDELKVANILYHKAGTIIIDDITASIFRYESFFNNTRSFSLKNSVLNLISNPMSNLQPAIYLQRKNYTLDATGSTIKFLNGNPPLFYLENTENNPIEFHNIEFLTSEANFQGFNLIINALSFKGNGRIQSVAKIQELSFSPGFQYELFSNCVLDVFSLLGGDACKGLIKLNTYQIDPGMARFNFKQDQVLSGYDITSIFSDSPLGNIQCQSSLDGGNNVGFTFIPDLPRVLYWVHNNQFWDDPQNWSLSSGGPTGECIPTLSDSVVFDDSSFFTKNENVSNSLNPNAYCRDLTFNVAGFTGSIILDNLNISRNFQILQNLNFQIEHLNLLGIAGTQQIRAANSSIKDMTMNGSSSVVLDQDLIIENNILINNGVLTTNDFTLTVRQLEVRSTLANVGIIAGNSEIIIGSNLANSNGFISIGAASFLEAQAAKFIFQSSESHLQIHAGNRAKMGEVLFENSEGTSYLSLFENAEIRKIEIRGNAELSSNNNSLISSTIDTLIFTEGRSYSILENHTIVINSLLRARGNNCIPISLFSFPSNGQSIIKIPANGYVDMDFVEMQNITGVGGAVFNAGPYSTNINNSNIGWIFPDLNIDNNIGVLGPDRFQCAGLDVILDANSFTQNEKYLWDNGDTTKMRSISSSGIYSVRIEFQNNCIVRDTIEIFNSQSFENFLPPDTIVCDKTPFIVDVKIVNKDIQYLWSDQSSQPTLTISQGGLYVVSVTLDGCTFSDSITANFIDFEGADLGMNVQSCQGEVIVLSLGVQNADVQWSTGSTQDSIIVTQTGTYFVRATKDVCTLFDTVIITFQPIPVFRLGPDTTLCQGESLLINPTISAATWVWQDGSNNPTFLASTSGAFSVTATENNCSWSDTIQVAVVILEPIELGPDLEVCEGDELSLTVMVSNSDLLWSTGVQDDSILVSQSGQYWVRITNGRCNASDSVSIVFYTLPVFNLGPDTTLCYGESVILNPSIPASTWQWQDGSSNSTFLASTEGIYFATATENNCSWSDTIQLAVVVLDPLELGADLEVCEGEEVSMAVMVSNSDIMWSTGAQVDSILVSQTGRYWVSISKGRCNASDSVSILFHPLPVFNLGQDTVICEGQSVELNPQLGYEVQWQDGSYALRFIAISSNLYTATASQNNCTYTDSILVSVTPIPVFELGLDTVLCNEATLELTIAIPGVEILWSDNSTGPTLSITQAGSYSAIASINGCVYSDQIDIIYLSLSKPRLIADTSICLGVSIRLQPQFLDGDEFIWSNGSNLNAQFITQAGTYIITSIKEQCSLSDTFVLSILPQPIIDIDDSYVLCEGQTLELLALGQFDRFAWAVQPGTDRINVSIPGTYVYSAQLGQCILNSFTDVVRADIPPLELGQDFEKCPDEIVNIGISNIPGLSAIWQDGVVGFNREVLQEGLYTLTLINQGCEKIDSISIVNRICDNTILYFPNIFYANSTSNRDFKPSPNMEFQIVSYYLMVFDRWGNKVFESKQLEEGWSGLHQGTELNPGLYTYVAEVEYSGRKQGKTVIPGNVTLIR